MPAAEWSHEAAQENQHNIFLATEIFERNLPAIDRGEGEIWSRLTKFNKSGLGGHQLCLWDRFLLSLRLFYMIVVLVRHFFDWSDSSFSNLNSHGKSPRK
jgi:hypothetical protein